MSAPKKQKTTASSSTKKLLHEAIEDLGGALVHETRHHLADELEQIRAERASAKEARDRIRVTLAPKQPLKASQFVENDGVYPNDSDVSVATTIKRACLKHYPQYDELETRKKIVVDLGANGILDTTKDSAQKQLFSDEDWQWILQKFPRRFDPESVLELNDDKLQQIEKLTRSGALFEARTLAAKMELNHRGATSTLFDVYHEYLKMLEFRKYIFRNDIDITEADAAIKIWGPLLESVMRDLPHLRLKWGDSIGDSDAFKVDVRAVQDVVTKCHKRKEKDTANVEIARLDASVSKIEKDRLKLFLESKCSLDRLVATTGADNAIICGLQLAGRKLTLFSLAMEGDGLYVAVMEMSATLPSTEMDIAQFRQVYKVLSSFKVGLRFLALKS
ncbi:hypothetical protein BC940DRAFT_291606 [Gongronella butleri]|nr:hypothetical protein BC940DRAFT_291606 [Gongronella butleri]